MPPQQLPPVTTGTIDRVPCPHCGKHNNFREIDGQQLLDTGSAFQCDHCGGMFEVTRIVPTKIVSVRKSDVRPRAGLPPAQQSTTLSAAQAQRLLRGGR